MHDIQAYETSNLGARVLFNVPLPMNPASTQLQRSERSRDVSEAHGWAADEAVGQSQQGAESFVMQCGFHAYMESWGVAVMNPYFAKTDDQGRFTIGDIPLVRTSWWSGILSDLDGTSRHYWSEQDRRRHSGDSGAHRTAVRQRGLGTRLHPL
ncbi:MAG: hypothetical protein U0361_20095 [Nitrospiraceae bacterium]